MTVLSTSDMSSVTGGDVITGFCLGFAAGSLIFPAATANPVGVAIGLGCIGYGLYNLIID